MTNTRTTVVTGGTAGLGLGVAQARLAAGDRVTVIVSLNGVGVVHGRIHWDDLMLERGYRTVEATKQAGRAAELLAVDHAFGRMAHRARYVLFHPGFTRTSARTRPWPGP